MSEREQFESTFRNIHKNQSEKSLDILLEWYNHGTQEEPDWGYYSLSARDAFLWWQASREALKAEQVGSWISCSERMPDIGEVVLTAKDGYVNFCEMDASGVNYRFFTSVVSGREVPADYWQPLPAPPSQPHPIDTTSQQYETLAKGGSR